MAPLSLAARLRALVLLLTLSPLASCEPSSHDLYYSSWYDWGLFGVYPRQWYKTFSLGAPQLNFLQWSERCDTGYTFMAPRGVMVWQPGPVIMDSKGELVWMEDKFGQAMDFKMQHYKGQDYLTFWTGEDTGTFGDGFYYMLDSSYEIYRTIRPANNSTGDLHEFKITEQGTALMTVYEPKSADMSAFGIEGEGWIYDSIFQEMDLETGELLFEWRASEHYDVEDTYYEPHGVGRTPDKAFDFFHINSIEKDNEGNYYISSRYFFSVTKISPSGEILWILGGKRNFFTDLSDGAATNFTWQHDARFHGKVGNNHTITLLDNGKFDGKRPHADYSRGLMLSLDCDSWTVTLLQDYIDPHHALTPSQGNVQILPRTNTVLIGWGYYASYTEFSMEGDVLCDVHISPEFIFNLGWVKSYREFRTNTWVGRPKTLPSIYLKPSERTLYVSWNGATGVDRWLLQGTEHDSSPGDGENQPFTNIVSAYKTKFETAISITSDMPTYIRVAAVDANGEVLGYSEIISRTSGNATFWDYLSQYVIFGGMLAGFALSLYYFILRRRRNTILPTIASSLTSPSSSKLTTWVNKVVRDPKSVIDRLRPQRTYVPLVHGEGDHSGGLVVEEEEEDRLDGKDQHDMERLYDG